MDIIEVLKKVYQTYTNSNRKISNDLWLKIKNSIEQQPKAAACVRDTSNVYPGLADSEPLRHAGMEVSASANVTSKKGRGNKRKADEPPTTPRKLYDKRTVGTLVTMDDALMVCS